MNHQDFRLLTDHDPFPWQEALYARLTGESPGGCPNVVSIPTGLGKTGVIAVWLIARANGADVPRRLVYVVNRRTVVDQTTTEAIRLRDTVKHLGIDNLAVSTLRGQLADNREWSADPTRLAVVCGTVDMIGSRLLFSGYRTGFKSRPLHAGFLGQDVLLVHDEAHLEPAFQQLVERIQKEQNECEAVGDLPWPKLRVMALSATARANSKAPESRLVLQSADHEHPEIQKRIAAHKELRLHACSDEKKQLAGRLVKCALAHEQPGDAILIFARQVNLAEEVLKQLRNKHSGQVAPLTGTMRGQERDDLVRENPVFARFMPERDRASDVTPASGTVYLVCTSAGEVGVNLSADHMVCDLTTLDSMVQRLGRTNRFGERDDSLVDVVHPESFDDKDRFAPAREATLRLLKELDGDASPQALGDLMESLSDEERTDAFAPTPTIPQATDILFDAWAMTTIRDKMPGRPPVAPYLHGLAEWEPPRTSVAWREEVEVIADEGAAEHPLRLLMDRYPPDELLEDYPLKPHEMLADTTERVYKALGDLVSRAGGDWPVWIIDERDKVSVQQLGDLLQAKKPQVVERLGSCTILLPPRLGGLSGGLLDGRAKDANDVADDWGDAQGKRRCRLWGDQSPPPGMALTRVIDTMPDADDSTEPDLDFEDETGAAVPSNRRRFWYWYARPAHAEDPTPASIRPVPWQDHTDAVVRWVTEFVDRLDLPSALRQALIVAAEWHDLGKKRELWQRSIGNPNPAAPNWYAKPGKPETGLRWRPRRISPYRHEFGSLLDVLDEKQRHRARLDAMDGEMRDVVLHLIAVHHGHGRPHFSPECAIDSSHSQTLADEASVEAMRRYARLQRRYGRWGLAYLESLLRAADWAASAEPVAAKSEFAQEASA